MDWNFIVTTMATFVSSKPLFLPQVFQSKAEEDDRRINQLEKDLKEAREKAEAADATYEEVICEEMVITLMRMIITDMIKRCSKEIMIRLQKNLQHVRQTWRKQKTEQRWQESSSSSSSLLS